MKKKVYLPVHTGQEAEFYSKKKLEKFGIKPNHPDYEKLLQELIQDFAHQSYKSMSANYHDLMDFEGENPTTAKINKKVFDTFKGMFGKGAFFDESANKNDAVQLERLFRSAITTLVKILLKVRTNMVLKSKEGRPSDLAFQPDSTKADNLQVLHNQYIQAYLASIMTAQLEPIFKAKAWDIEQIIKSIGDERLNKAVDPNTPKEVRYDILHNDEMRRLFSKSVYEGYKKGMIEPYHRTVKEQRQDEEMIKKEQIIETAKKSITDLIVNFAEESKNTDLDELYEGSKKLSALAELPMRDPLNLIEYAYSDLGLSKDAYETAKERLRSIVEKSVKTKTNPKKNEGIIRGFGKLVKAEEIGKSKAKAYVKIENPTSRGRYIIVSGIVPKSSMKEMFIKEIVGVELDITKGRHGLTKVSKIV
jgi:hypothetical protein